MHLPSNNSCRHRQSGVASLARAGGTLLLVLLPLAPWPVAAATNLTSLTPTRIEKDSTQEVMRAYLQLQEQLHAAQLAIQRSQEEAAQAAARSAEAISNRLKALELSLAEQSAQERTTIEAIQNTNLLLIKIGSACAAAAFLAVFLTAYFQWRAVNRLTEFSVLSRPSMGHAGVTSPGTVEAPPSAAALTDQVNTRLLGAIERLEKRILELEYTARPPLAERTAAETPPANPAPSAGDRFRVLMAKGESLLSLDKTEEALACFDEILAAEPEHSEALVKKGDALERLRKIDDAIDCYDRAIAAGRSLTVAYLHKGGLFNRLERYEEALQCYEQALRTQEKSHTA